VNIADEQVLRQKLREEIGRADAGPPPVDAAIRRGKAIRVRRRVITAAAAPVLAAVVAVWALASGGPGKPGPVVGSGPGVTLNAPDPGAPGGVFASGTADGQPWTLAAANIAGTAPWCLPAVMLGGHTGDVLFGATGGGPAISNPAFLTDIPGRPGIGVAFVQLKPEVTKIVAALPGGSVSQRPVTLTLCGQRFHLAGFAFGNARRGIKSITAYSALGQEETLDLPPATFTAGTLPSGTFSAGVWDNLDTSPADNQASSADTPIGAGRVDGISWTIKTGLGLFGQCYTGAAVAGSDSGQARECLPVEAPPRGIALAWVPFPATTAAITGYAGLVSPRTAYLVASLSSGATRRLAPDSLGGRKYISLAVGRGSRLVRLTLYDAVGHPFATTTSIPAAR
jgi:hypothetical protein